MCFDIVQGKALYNGKMGFGTAPRRYMIHSKPQPLLQKTYLFHASKTLVASMIALVQAAAYVRRPRVTLVFYFQK